MAFAFSIVEIAPVSFASASTICVIPLNSVCGSEIAVTRWKHFPSGSPSRYSIILTHATALFAAVRNLLISTPSRLDVPKLLAMRGKVLRGKSAQPFISPLWPPGIQKHNLFFRLGRLDINDKNCVPAHLLFTCVRQRQ